VSPADPDRSPADQDGADSMGATAIAPAPSRYAGQAPVDVVADLTLTVEGQPVSVESYTDLVIVDLPSVRIAWPLYRGLRRHLGTGDTLLHTLDLTVELRVDGTTVARAGSGARPQLDDLPVEFDLPGLARAAVEAPIRFFS
jgi:hypothetical protein